MGGRATAVAEKAHEHGFVADRLMRPAPRLLGGKNHHSPRSFRESVHHDRLPRASRRRARGYIARGGTATELDCTPREPPLAAPGAVALGAERRRNRRGFVGGLVVTPAGFEPAISTLKGLR